MAENRRARHDAAALADYVVSATRRRSHRQRVAQGVAGEARLPAHPLEEREHAADGIYKRSRTEPAKVKAKLVEMVRTALVRTNDVRQALHAQLQPVGPAPVPGAEQ